MFYKVSDAQIFLVLIIVCTARESEPVLTIDLSQNLTLFKFEHFWKNTGFCPLGQITNPSIRSYLLSDDVRTNLNFIAALPNSGIESVRVHWLLELIDFIEFNEHGIPGYDFRHLDTFLEWVNETQLSIGFELMGNPSGLFSRPSVDTTYLWEDLVFQVASRYIRKFGPSKVSSWKFETWNEPDLTNYNLLHFTTKDYTEYVEAVRFGLSAAERIARNLRLKLHGPAGLFKGLQKHQLCWGALQKCNDSPKCIFDVITFHRKGNGNAEDVVHGGKELIQEVYEKYPNIRGKKLANNEADPISGWSTGRKFQSNVDYAQILALIVLNHWSAKLNAEEFEHLAFISHDNAFLSYHPHEFDQRTLLARFQMNLSDPQHTQFVQKPVYSVLGMLANLGQYATDKLSFENGSISGIRTTNDLNSKQNFRADIYISETSKKRHVFQVNVTHNDCDQNYAVILETLEKDVTDPVKVWEFFGSPPYPNATIRKALRSAQSPRVLEHTILKSCTSQVSKRISLRSPFILEVRVCSSSVQNPPAPQQVTFLPVNKDEVLIFWKEIKLTERCIKNYEIFFKKINGKTWEVITHGWHIPFLSFHFHPVDGNIFGEYKVRAVDLFLRKSNFSIIGKYLQN